MRFFSFPQGFSFSRRVKLSESAALVTADKPHKDDCFEGECFIGAFFCTHCASSVGGFTGKKCYFEKNCVYNVHSVLLPGGRNVSCYTIEFNLNRVGVGLTRSTIISLLPSKFPT